MDVSGSHGSLAPCWRLSQLSREAWGLLRQWEQDNVALRAEARLGSAVERVKGGFNGDAPEARAVSREILGRES